MYKNLLKLFRCVPGVKAVVPKPTVASVTAHFNKAIADLEAVEKEATAEARREAEAVIAANRRQEAATREAQQAAVVRSKIQALVSA